MPSSSKDREAILEQLGRILGSEAFRGSERSRNLLSFLVERTAGGLSDTLKEYTLGTEVLGRRDSFDPRTDPIVRAEASRLRQRLELYHATEGRSDSFVITLPKGSYVPEFEDRLEPDTHWQNAAAKPIWRWKVATAALAVALALALWAPWRGTQFPQQRPIRLDVDLGPGRFVGSEVGVDVALSPDGTWLVFVALDSEGKTHLFKRRLDQSDSSEITGTEGSRNPFFSPDGNWIAFWADGKLKKTLLDGGSSRTLCEATDLLGGSWGEDGVIVAALDGTSRIYRVPSDGGAPEVLADLGKDSMNPKWPQVLPGSKALLFTSTKGPSDNSAIGVLSLTDKKTKLLIRGGTYGRYLADGHLVYVNRGKLFAVPFSLDRLEVRGTPIPVLDDVSYSSLFGYAQFDSARSGTFVYRRSLGKGTVRLTWLDSSGNTKPLMAKPGVYLDPHLSPDGQRLAFSIVDGERADIWMLELASNKLTRLTSGDRNYFACAWSPDSRFLIMAAESGGLFWRRLDGSGNQQSLTTAKNIQNPWSFTSDGKRLAYFEMNPKTGFDIWTVPIETSGSGLRAGNPEPFLQTKAFEVYPAFSRDGRWLAYGSNESGTWQVYVRAFPDNGKALQVSVNGGRIPAWSPNGRDLLYRTDEQRIMVAAYRVDGDSFSVEQPHPWSRTQLADTGVLSNFDLAPDGKFVAALMPAASPDEEQTKSHVTFFLNFFDELQRRSPQTRK